MNVKFGYKEEGLQQNYKYGKEKFWGKYFDNNEVERRNRNNGYLCRNKYRVNSRHAKKVPLERERAEDKQRTTKEGGNRVRASRTAKLRRTKYRANTRHAKKVLLGREWRKKKKDD